MALLKLLFSQSKTKQPYVKLFSVGFSRLLSQSQKQNERHSKIFTSLCCFSKLFELIKEGTTVRTTFDWFPAFSEQLSDIIYFGIP